MDAINSLIVKIYLCKLRNTMDYKSVYIKKYNRGYYEPQDFRDLLKFEIRQPAFQLNVIKLLPLECVSDQHFRSENHPGNSFSTYHQLSDLIRQIL